MTVQIIEADYQNLQHRTDIPFLLNEYAKDPMGGGEALPDYVRENLVSHMADVPGAMTLIAYVDERPAGLLNAFPGFSTFACKPLMNIHDVVVLSECRGMGISQMLLEKTEQIARERGCCKVTMEVLSNNHVARSAYEKAGYACYSLDPEAGHALFWQKKL